jgi:hypothetical protein
MFVIYFLNNVYFFVCMVLGACVLYLNTINEDNFHPFSGFILQISGIASAVRIEFLLDLYGYENDRYINPFLGKGIWP